MNSVLYVCVTTTFMSPFGHVYESWYILYTRVCVVFSDCGDVNGWTHIVKLCDQRFAIKLCYIK